MSHLWRKIAAWVSSCVSSPIDEKWISLRARHVNPPKISSRKNQASAQKLRPKKGQTLTPIEFPHINFVGDSRSYNSQPSSACFQASRVTSGSMDSVGDPLGQACTQFCALAHSWNIRPFPSAPSNRSLLFTSPPSMLHVNSLTWLRSAPPRTDYAQSPVVQTAPTFPASDQVESG